MDTKSTMGIPRFRILCVGRAGAGKSSLINRVLGATMAKVSEYAPGEATIYQEFISENNPCFVLHDSKGFEPGDNANFDLTAQFLQERHRKELPNDRLHAIWLCAETPRAGGRVLELGDKKLLALAHELQIPVIVVFTKYDLLVWSKKLEREEEAEGMTIDDEALHRWGQEDARDALTACVLYLEKSVATLKIPIPPSVNISISRGYDESVAILADMTRSVVRER